MNLPIVSVFIGAIGIIFGGVFLIAFDPIYDAIIETQLVLTEGSYSYDLWKELPEDLRMEMKLYYYNVTNFQEVIETRGRTKPNLVEVGPYVFRERHIKDNIVWNDNNGTVTYQQKKIWEHIDENNGLSLDDRIFNINIVALAAMQFAKQVNDIFYVYSINGLINEVGASMFMNFTVKECTFEGIVDPMIDGAIDSGVPLPIPFDRFGWFYPRNDSLDYDGTFSMFTGSSGIENVGQISEWNYQAKINESVYTSYCGQLNGSAGEFFPPGRGKDYVDFFTPDLCRSIRFEYDSQVDVDGARGYRYKLTERLVSNSTIEPDNACFNPSPTLEQHLPNGLLNVSACKFSAPAYVSYPHFYQADPVLIDQFQDGSQVPDQSKHESYLSLDPYSGIPLEVAVRMQINALAAPLKMCQNGNENCLSIEIFDDLEPTFYPMIWFETVTRIDADTDMGFLVVLVTKLHMIALAVGVSIICIGAVFALSGGIFAWKRKRADLVSWQEEMKSKSSVPYTKSIN